MVRYIQTHLEVPKWKAAADKLFSLMIFEGRIAEDPDPPTAGERAIFAVNQFNYTVGMSVFYYPADNALTWLHLLYVEPAYRRQGIASELIRLTAQAGQDDGRVRIGLGVPFKNYDMMSLAKTCGFADIGAYLTMPISELKGGGV
jgi:GNAT superfamily N-acetyltransferase